MLAIFIPNSKIKSMAIERLSIEEGTRVDFEKADDLEHLVLELFTSAVNRVKNLAAGEYDITPSLPYQVPYCYSLIVHEDGTASYRVFPVIPEAIKVTYSADGEPTAGPGGEFTAIPDDTSLAIIAAPLSVTSLQLYEAIRFIPQD
jgi:hypothetical protein